MEKKKDQFVGRTRARSRAADILFEADQKRLIRPPAILLTLLEERKETSASEGALPEYAVRIVEGFSSTQREVDALLEKHIKGTKLSRIPSVDRAVLRVAVWEMLFNREEVPAVTAIDEAIKVAKPVATDDSPDFINGVLDAVRESLEDPWARQPEGAVEAPVEDVADSEEPSDEAAAVEVAEEGVPTGGEDMDDEDLDLLLDQY